MGRDMFAESLWANGSALIGAGLLGLFIGGHVGAGVGVVIALALMLTYWKR